MQAIYHIGTAPVEQTLDMALELSNGKWELGFSEESKWRQRTVTAGDQQAVLAEIAGAKAKLELSESVWVRSCDEAGRDGLWLHPWRRREGIENEVLDAARIEVKRRARQVKTDRHEEKRCQDHF